MLAGGRRAQPPPPRDSDLVALVRASGAGDQLASSRLVGRFERTLRAVTRFYGLSPWDADDVIQTTCLRFAEHGRDLREPAVIGWLKTTARRESLRILQAHVRERPTDDPTLGESIDHVEPDSDLVDAERRAALRRALEELPDRHRRLMTLLITEPNLSYEELGKRLAMPVGSIGPIRARCVARLLAAGGWSPFRRGVMRAGGTSADPRFLALAG